MSSDQITVDLEEIRVISVTITKQQVEEEWDMNWEEFISDRDEIIEGAYSIANYDFWDIVDESAEVSYG